MGYSLIDKNLNKIFTNPTKNSLAKIKAYNRDLTIGEIKLAQIVFKDTINYSLVKIFEGSFFPFNLQNEDTFVTPNGNIYVPSKNFKSDYSKEDVSFQHVFIHEMGHVWQYQRKISVLINAGIAQACTAFKDPYKYSIQGSETVYDYVQYKNQKKFINYNLESQAEIFADYWALKTNNINAIKKKNIKNINSENIQSSLEVYETKVREVIK